MNISKDIALWKVSPANSSVFRNLNFKFWRSSGSWNPSLIIRFLLFLGLITVTIDADDAETAYFTNNFPTDAKAFITFDTNVKDEAPLVKPVSGDPADIVFTHTYTTPGCRNITLQISNSISSIKETREVRKLLYLRLLNGGVDQLLLPVIFECWEINNQF